MSSASESSEPMTNAGVSVLVTSYNHERYLGKALESVFQQEFTGPFEVIVCDDGSSDGTRKVIEEFAKRHPDRLRFALREKNGGDKGLANFLTGLQMCTGEYIAMLDGDDYWIDPQKLMRQVEYLKANPTHAMCFHNCRVEYDDPSTESWETKRFLARQSLTTEDFLTHAMGQTSTMMIRRDVAEKLRESVRFLDDWLLSDWFTAIVASRIGPVGYMDPVMSVFRQHRQSGFTSLGRATQWAEFVYGYEAVGKMLGPAYEESIQRAICVRSYTAASEYEKAGDFAKAREFLQRVLRGKAEWLEPHYSGQGLTGDELFERVRQRERLYRFPMFAALWCRLEKVSSELRWRWRSAAIRVRAHIRLRRGQAVGHIRAFPNPAVASARSEGRANVTIRWSAAAARTVEVRLGRPNGPLFSRSGDSGTKPAGEWVSDGMVFYLQNVTGDRPLTFRNTLDAVRVRVKS